MLNMSITIQGKTWEQILEQLEDVREHAQLYHVTYASKSVPREGKSWVCEVVGEKERDDTSQG